MAVSNTLVRGVVVASVAAAAAGGYAWKEHAAVQSSRGVVLLRDDQEGGSGLAPLTVHDTPRIGDSAAPSPAVDLELTVPAPDAAGAEPAESFPQTAEAVPETAMLSPGVVDSPPSPPKRALPPAPAPAGAAPPTAAAEAEPPAGEPEGRTSAIPDKGFTREIVFFATDRERNERAKTAKDMFTTKRGRLEYGVCQVSVPDNHERGEIETKKWYQWKEDPRKHILILEPLQLLDRNGFVREVKGRVGKGSNRQVLVFVHGYNVSFESALQRTAQLAHDLEFPGAAICYSWPSGNSGNYATDWTNAEWTTPHCVEFLELVATQLGATKVDLVAHSMGSRVLTNALKETAVRWGSLSDRPLFHQVVLAAPDLDAEIFRTQIAPAIRRTGQRLTVYTSTKDKALQLSETVNGYARLGSGGATLAMFRDLPWLECVDATALLDDSWLGLRHSYYGDSPQLIRDMRQVLNGLNAPARGLAHTPDGSYVVR